MQMANNQETCNLRSNVLMSNLALTESDPEQIFRGTDDPSFDTTFRNLRCAMQEPAVTLEALLESGDEGPRSSPTHRTTPAPDIPYNLPDLLEIRIFLHVAGRRGKNG